MSALIVFGADADVPRAPAHFHEAVETWARRSGRHARVEFVPFLACWCVLIDRKPDDPTRRVVQESMIPIDVPRELRDYMALSAEHEVVQLQVPAPGGYMALGLEEMGAAGVVEFLERGDTWSGRGEFDSLHAGAMDVLEQNLANRERVRENIIEGARQIARDRRRTDLGIPLVRGADLI